MKTLQDLKRAEEGVRGFFAVAQKASDDAATTKETTIAEISWQVTAWESRHALSAALGMLEEASKEHTSLGLTLQSLESAARHLRISMQNLPVE